MPKGTTSFFQKSDNNNRKSGDMPDRKAQLPFQDLLSYEYLMNTITQEFFSCQTSSIAKNDTFRQFRNRSAVRRFRQKKS